MPGRRGKRGSRSSDQHWTRKIRSVFNWADTQRQPLDPTSTARIYFSEGLCHILIPTVQRELDGGELVFSPRHQTRRRRPCITATLLPVTHDLAPRCELLRWNRCYAQRKQNRITGIASYQRRRPRQGQPRCRANQRQGCTPARNYCRHRGARGKITAPHDSRGRAEHQETNLRARWTGIEACPRGGGITKAARFGGDLSSLSSFLVAVGASAEKGGWRGEPEGRSS